MCSNVDDTKTGRYRSTATSSWSELHSDLLELIMKKVAPVDILRFRAVCSSWNEAARSYISVPHNSTLDVPQSTPWLMNPIPPIGVHTGRFFNLAENKLYSVENAFGDFPGAWCVGSSHGWLVLVAVDGNARLSNPFSGHRIQLPSLFTLPGCFGSYISRDYITKVITTSKPSSSSSFKDFSVVMIYGQIISNLAFYRHGDKAWTGFGNKTYVQYRDIVFHSTNGHLYTLAVDCSVQVWDFRTCLPMKRYHVHPFQYQVMNIDDKLYDHRYSIQSYLVESLVELLLVRRVIVNDVYCDKNDRRCLNTFGHYRTCHFYVYRLMKYTTEEEFEWEKVETLNDQSLFLGVNHSMLLSSRNFPECKENSIYFTDDRWLEMNTKYVYGDTSGAHIGGHDVGVYNYKDKVLNPTMPCLITTDDCWSINPPPVWIVPDIIP